MSWSISTTVPASEDVGAAIDKAFHDSPAAREHAGPQADVAKAAVLALVSGVARDVDEVAINASGHYNADKTPAPGWADCMITVSVRQVVPKAES